MPSRRMVNIVTFEHKTIQSLDNAENGEEIIAVLCCVIAFTLTAIVLLRFHDIGYGSTGGHMCFQINQEKRSLFLTFSRVEYQFLQIFICLSNHEGVQG